MSHHRFPAIFVLLIALLMLITSWGYAASAAPVALRNPARNTHYLWDFGGEATSVATSANLLLAGIGQHLVVFDNTHPAAPVKIAQTEPLIGLLSDLAIEGDYAYARTPSAGSAFGSNGGALLVFDLHDLLDPQQIALYEPPPSSYEIRCVTVSGDFAYLGSSDGLEVLDISDPANPVEFSSLYLNDDVEQVEITGGYVYAVTDDLGLKVISVSDPAHPQATDTFLPAGDAEVTSVFIQGNRAAVAGEYHASLLDLSDPAHPALLGSAEVIFPEYAAFAGNMLYTNNQFLGGVTIFDMSNPAHPVQGITLPSARSLAPFVASGNRLFFPTYETGIQALNVTAPANPTLELPIPAAGWFSRVQVSGHYAYTSGTDFSVFDLSEITAPHRLGRLPSTADLLAVADGYAYLEDAFYLNPGFDYFLRIVDATNPSVPVLASSLQLDSQILDVAVLGDFAYLATESSGLVVLDVSDKAHPSLRGGIPDASLPGDRLAVRVDPGNPAKTYAFVMPRSPDPAMLRVADVSNPDAPQLVGYLDRPGFYTSAPAGVALDGDLAYLLNEGDGVQVVNIADPANPVSAPIQIPFFSQSAFSIAIQGNFLYFAAGLDSLEIYGKTGGNGSADAYYYVPSYGYEAASYGTYVLVAGADSGLYAVWAGPSTEGDLPASGGVLTSLYDGTSYDFPAGAFSQDSGATHKPLYPSDQPMPAIPLYLAGPIFDVSQQVYNVGDTYYTGLPFTMTVPYDPDKLGGVPEYSLMLYRLENDTWMWTPVAGTTLDCTAHTLNASLIQFGTYAVFGEQEAGGYLFLPLIKR